MDWNTPETKRLIESFLSLTTPQQARAYLRDLLTEGEIMDLAKRLETARLLSQKVPYPSIQTSTGFSTTTIARVSKWLQSGEGGYASVLHRMHHHSPSLVGRGLS